MSQHRPNKPWALALALTALVAMALLPASAQAEMRRLGCEYVESGPPGPAGNLLVITGNDNAQVRREGDRVLVGTSAANGPRDFEAVPCRKEATVTNIDRIVYWGTALPPQREHQFLLDEREGPLGPGASPEPTDPEIEVEVVLPDQPQARPRVQLLGTEGRENFTVGDFGDGRLGVSLEPIRTLYTPDADLTVAAPPRTVELKLHGSGGKDVLDARHLDLRHSLVRSVLLAGDNGKDALLGTEREDHLQGGAGPDRLFGRGGRDFLYPSAGSDLTIGGSGDDYIDARRGDADEISCGAGRDEAVVDDKDIETPRGGRCERLRGPGYS
jgi:Ca2+-binding RTX toxin-like protein